jgi:hypothetical protein
MEKPDIGRMRTMDLNEPVTLTLPAHVWLGFLASYSATKWACMYATAIHAEAMEALLDPLWLKEREAARARRHDQEHALMSRIIPGFPAPDIPPDAGGLSGDNS